MILSSQESDILTEFHSCVNVLRRNLGLSQFHKEIDSDPLSLSCVVQDTKMPGDAAKRVRK